jgi:hypothetical protein
MKNSKLFLVGLILTLTLFFNIERVDLNNTSIVNIQTFVYIIGVLIPTVTLFVPYFMRMNLIQLGIHWILLYAFLKIAFSWINSHPIFIDTHIFVTLSEVFFVLMISYLSGNLIRCFLEAEAELLDASNSHEVKNFLKLENAKKIIHTEFTRSRHYKRPMSIIVLEANTLSIDAAFSKLVQEIQRNVVLDYTRSILAKSAQSSLRLMDVIMQGYKKDELIIMCPEVDKNQSSKRYAVRP